MCSAILSVEAQYHCTVMSATRSNVTLRCTGYGKNAKIASAAAELSAINTLLYIGATGTPFSLPLIPDKASAENKNETFFDSFNKSEYKNFIESSITVTAFGKDAEKRKCIVKDVCVRAEQLRSYLETNGIIRKFGF